MSLPRLRAALTDSRDIARVLRGALRHEVEDVPLVEPVTPGQDQYVLEVAVSETEIVTLLADVKGRATREGQPLHVRPITRPQAAALFDLIERLDEPSKTIPPSGPDPSDGDPPPELDGDTLYDASLAVGYRAPSFGPDSGPPPSSRPNSDPPSIAIVAKVSGAGTPGFSASVGNRKPSRPEMSAVKAPTLPAEAATSGDNDSSVGRIIAGKYKVDSLIGQGSTAAVYRAVHIDLRRPVAVKILHQSNRSEQQFARRFRAEALAASKLEHPNVARVIDFGHEPDGLLYLVMELLTGRSLESALVTSTRLPAAKAVEVAIQTCNALAFAHDEGIIHRDIKPENIMLVPSKDDDGRPCELVKVCDFGLAKLREPDPDSRDLTVSGMLLGSPAYMSPEQTRGEVLDARTDLYSLGVTLYECLSGELPHQAETLAELFLKKVVEPPRRLRVTNPDIDPLLDDIVMRAIATSPAKRYANARVFREELREVLRGLVKERDEDERDGTIVAD